MFLVMLAALAPILLPIIIGGGGLALFIYVVSTIVSTAS